MKNKEFLELKQGNRSVAEYECEFVQFSKYAREIVSSEEKMYIRFEDDLKDEIKLLVGAMEIREFVVLFDRAQKMETVHNCKKQREMKAYDFHK